MTRRKGERTDKHRNRSHPFQVAFDQVSGPAGYDVMYRWAAWFDFETTSNGRDGMHWCFCRPEVADAFAMDFGGRRIDRAIYDAELKHDLPDARELQRRARCWLIGVAKMTGGHPLAMIDPFQEAAKIPFSSFNDPADVARAQGALDQAWAAVKDTVPEQDQPRERARLAYIVASFTLVAVDEQELARRAIERFHQSPSGR